MKLNRFFLSAFCALVGIFLFASPTFAGSPNDNCNGIPNMGYKYVKFYVTGNPALIKSGAFTYVGPVSGGTVVCIEVEKSKQSLTYEELSKLSPELISMTGMTPDVLMCYIPLDDRIDGCAGRDHAEDVNFTFSNDKKRYVIQSGRTSYMYFVGEQLPTETEEAALNSCRQEVYGKLDTCQTPEFDSFESVQEALNALTGECKTLFDQCVRDVTNLTETKPEGDAYENDPRYGVPKGYVGPLPACSFSYKGCRDINDFLTFFINLGKTLFEVIGTFAFVMFIYGGFTMILSMGNAEKVKKGQEFLVAALVGIIIAFGAYLMIDFVLDALQVGKDFRAIGTVKEADPNLK